MEVLECYNHFSSIKSTQEKEKGQKKRDKMTVVIFQLNTTQ